MHRRSFLAIIISSFVLIESTTLSAAPMAREKELLVGANIDLGQLLPNGSSYLRTNKGDLFDIAKAFGISVLRLTTVETWNTGEEDRPYSTEEWRAVGKRAAATGISLIPLVRLPIAANVWTSPDATRYFDDYKALVDKILADAGLSEMGVVFALDLANEPVLTTQNIELLSSLSDYVHRTYPAIRVTVGGWRVATDAARFAAAPTTNARWTWNRAEDGQALVSLVDIVSIHVYEIPSQMGGGPLGGSDPDVIRRSIRQYLGLVQQWAHDKPILIGEFGTSNGISPIRSQLQARSMNSPLTQDELIRAFGTGIDLAAHDNPQILGAMVWLLSPRGRARSLNEDANAFALLIPRGPGQEVTLLPGLRDLCASLSTNCPKAPGPGPIIQR